ncbi:MAG TPA: efflux RND transporter permease subunit [Bryobacteraceae bacterium]|jgi:multidrug efflux pump subunit AcrB|nr:efflux RND transporter permease subunit [Bryobacteraceae bacterium]
MRLVLFALSRPLTIIVAVIGVALAAILAVARMDVDIFPNVGEKAIYVAQPYSGMDPAQMEGFLNYYFEYHFLYINGIQYVQSRNVQGNSLMKLVFQPDTDMSDAMAQTVGYVNRARSFMPPGTVPPFITRFDAGSVPVGQLTFVSPNRTQGEIQNLALNSVRPVFATLPGVSAPPPFGGNQRTIVVTLNPDKLREYGISPDQATAAVSAATLVMPSGNVRIGKLNLFATTNATLGADLDALLATPLRTVAGPTIFLRDIGTVADSTDILTAYAHVNGRRSVYIPVTKRASASTLSVINEVKAALPDLKKLIPPDINIRLDFDQSPYVTNSLKGLIFEASLGALLTGLMVLLFLHDWRSSIIVVINIPFAILTAVVLLWAARQTINIMTLGGLALAVGVLVDESTVEIENTHSHMVSGVSRARVVLDATRRTAIPRLLSMLCILAVFMPSFFLAGVGRQLFVPLSLAVAFAMIASYLLSSSLVPVLSTWIMRPKHEGEEGRGAFGAIRNFYGGYLNAALRFRWPLAIGYLALSILFLWLVLPLLGTEIFPQVNAPLFQLRLRTPTGTRIEQTEPLVLQVINVIKKEAGPDNVVITSDYMGTQPASYPVDLIYLFTAGPQDTVLRVALKPGIGVNEALRERIRQALHRALPHLQVGFEAGDIISQVMSFGSPTPVQVDVQGPALEDDYNFAQNVYSQLKGLAFLRDLQFAQTMDYPTVHVEIDRARVGQFGLTMSNIAQSFVEATGSSRFTSPNYWRDPRSGNAFQIQVEYPQHEMQSLDQLRAVPVMPLGENQPYLGDVAKITTPKMPGEIDRFNGQRVITLTANLHNLPLGKAIAPIRRAIAGAGTPPRAVSVHMRGEAPALEQTLQGLRTGLLLAVAVIFLLLAANFQSFRLSLIVILTMPAVLCGVAILLLATGTTLNVQSFIGGIMALGISVANSILLIAFAEQSRVAGQAAHPAAHDAALGRLRAILMTASAMIFGMLPMALGLSEGGSETAPLGLAVIGGLLFSTFATLTVVPALYSILQQSASTRSPSLNPSDPSSRYYEPSH